MDGLTETKSQLIWLLKQVRRDKQGMERVTCGFLTPHPPPVTVGHQNGTETKGRAWNRKII